MTHPKKVWHLGEDGKWRAMTMEAIDANHAVQVDPDHWSFEKPADEKEPASETEKSPVLTLDHLDKENQKDEGDIF